MRNGPMVLMYIKRSNKFQDGEIQYVVALGQMSFGRYELGHFI